MASSSSVSVTVPADGGTVAKSDMRAVFSQIKTEHDEFYTRIIAVETKVGLARKIAFGELSV